MRREFSRETRRAAWARAKGSCESCTVAIREGMGPHYDHATPDAMGGEPTLENCAVLCKNCHSTKTASVDIPRIAKSKRVLDRRIGARGAGRGFPKRPDWLDPWTRRARVR